MDVYILADTDSGNWITPKAGEIPVVTWRLMKEKKMKILWFELWWKMYINDEYIICISQSIKRTMSIK